MKNKDQLLLEQAYQSIYENGFIQKVTDKILGKKEPFQKQKFRIAEILPDIKSAFTFKTLHCGTSLFQQGGLYSHHKGPTLKDVEINPVSLYGMCYHRFKDSGRANKKDYFLYFIGKEKKSGNYIAFVFEQAPYDITNHHERSIVYYLANNLEDLQEAKAVIRSAMDEYLNQPEDRPLINNPHQIHKVEYDYEINKDFKL